MTDAQIREIRELYDGATPGEWRAVDNGNTVPSHVIKRYVVGENPVNIACGISPKTGNAEFIVAAHNIMPALLDELDRLREENVAWSQINDAAAFEYNKLRAELKAAKEPEHTKPKTGLCYMCKYAYDGGMRCKIPIKERGEPFCTRWERGGPVAENTPAPEMGAPGDGVGGAGDGEKEG